ncbi:MAG: hypothetical protein ACYDBJ_25385 [Aggregatilineales bacterium]
MRKILVLMLCIVGFTGPLTGGTAPNTARFAGLTERLGAEIGSHRMGVYVIPLDNPRDAFGVNEDVQVPSASAWKGGGIVYFFEYVDPAITNSVPVQYWEKQNITRVPPAYQKAWFQYNKILHDAYIMTVFSGNHEGGNILAYVYTLLPAPRPRNPIIAFNDWSLSVGMTPESGMWQWMAGGTWAVGYTDPRYATRQFFPGDKTPLYNVTYSARDFANFFYHLATVGKQKGYYNKAVELLAIRNQIVSLIEACPETAPSTGMITASKDGYFRPDSPDSQGHDVDNDAGLLIFPDGATYVVAFTAFDSHDIAYEVVCNTIQAIVDDHNRRSMF